MITRRLAAVLATVIGGLHLAACQSQDDHNGQGFIPAGTLEVHALAHGRRDPTMGEVAFAVSDADNGLREHLDKEINAFNAATTGYYDGRLLCIAVREAAGDLRAGLFGVDVGRVRLH